MSDLAVFALGAAICAGAWLAAGVVAWPVAAAVCVVALVLRRPWVLVVGGGVLASTLAAAAWAGLAPPAPVPVSGVAVLVGDPVVRWGAVRVEVRIDGHRVEAWARGSAGAALRSRLTGEQVRLRGRLRAPPASARSWLAVRHVAARLDVEEVGAWAPGNRVSRLANGLRRLLARGARDLDVDDRSLLGGVALGDDREQPAPLREAFLGAGLSHLTAASGQNLAYLLALAGPVLRRLDLRGRWVVTVGLVLFFGLLTRWEPSVLRASAMAALACTATAAGRPTSRLRMLALAVSGCVLVDPLLVHAVGFQLSVGATAGIAVLAAPLARRLPGPRWLAESLAVTVAAQVGVAPVAVPVFGGLPLASLPANLLAVPAAAPLTAWGLTGGLVAGVLGPPFDGWLHLPTRLLAGWLAGVARWADALPLGQVRAGHALVLAGLVVAVGSARWSSTSARTASTSPRGPS